MSFRVRRSSLILPVNVPRFIEKAHTRGADAIVLDLEDSVPPAEKASARELVKAAIPLVARGGAEVAVRINNDPALISDDIEASVWPGLSSLSIPKVESAAELERLVAQIERLERGRGIPVGHVKLSVAIETPRGLLACETIATASPRIVTMGVGPEDYYLSLGVEPSADGIELLYAVSRVVTVCKAVGIQSVGLLGSIAGFRDLAAFEAADTRGRNLGCEGAGCIHPEQVVILNRVFSPDPERVQYARRAVDAFEEGLRQGTASVNLDGKMVDVPVYRHAQIILERAQAIAELERAKAEALARNR